MRLKHALRHRACVTGTESSRDWSLQSRLHLSLASLLHLEVPTKDNRGDCDTVLFGYLGVKSGCVCVLRSRRFHRFLHNDMHSGGVL